MFRPAASSQQWRGRGVPLQREHASSRSRARRRWKKEACALQTRCPCLLACAAAVFLEASHEHQSHGVAASARVAA